MEEARWLARYGTIALVIIAGVEWLLGRTVSRLAAAPMLEGTPRAVIEGLGKVGFFLVSPALLLSAGLAMLAAVLIGRDALAERASISKQSARPAVGFRFGLACYLALFVVVVAAHTLFGTQVWLNISFNLMSLILVWWLAGAGIAKQGQPLAARIGVGLVALAYTGWYLYVLGQLLNSAGAGGDRGEWSIASIRLGELAAILTPFAFFVAVAGQNGRWRNLRRWIAPVIVAALFSAGNIADATFNQGFTGVFTTWSVGLNLVWPWPVYAVSLALFLYSVITAFTPGEAGAHKEGEDAGQAHSYANPNTGAGLLLLLFAGYNLQIPYEHLLAILSLTLLAGLFRPLGGVQNHAPDTSNQTVNDTIVSTSLAQDPSSIAGN